MLRLTGNVIGLIAGALFGLLPALAAAVEPVATVEPVEGQLSLNRGHGFKAIIEPTQANAGDLVMVSPGGDGKPGGHGKIVYSEGCVVDVYPGAVVGVAGSCKVAMAKPMTLAPTCDPKDLKCFAPPPTQPIWPLFVAAAGITGLVCGLACEQQSISRPR